MNKTQLMKLTLQLIAYLVKIQGLVGGRVVKGSRFKTKKLEVASLIPAAVKIFFSGQQTFKK